MPKKFNGGKAYHGSSAVEGGKLRGATDTDYFYFFCPSCPGEHLLRVLDYELRAESPKFPYPELKPTPAKGFVLAFKVHCQKCGLTDFVKIGNLGWQAGTHSEALKKTCLCPTGRTT